MGWRIRTLNSLIGPDLLDAILAIELQEKQ